MPVRSLKNQYSGVNAHLHSLLQGEGGWSGFHSAHIAHMTTVLKAQLLPLGYTAEIAPSLQIRRIDDTGQTIELPESDVMIFDTDPVRSSYPHPATQMSSVGELVLSIEDTLLKEARSRKQYDAIMLYQTVRPHRGEPIVWIEILSPSNKPGGQDAEEYYHKRSKIIENEIVFVEVDYLHESAPTMRGVANYRRRKRQPDHPEAHPYRIAIFEPRPDMQQGKIRIREFDVDAPIPTVTIPLSGDDVLDFDFGIPYRKTFEEMFYGLELVDYSQLPVHFERYSEVDQTRIAARMLAVLEAAQQGITLENALLPTVDISLTDALAQIKLFAAAY